MDQGPDPAIFVIDLQDANQKTIFSCLLLFESTYVHLHHFLKIKGHKDVTKQ
jgi:hypothetical protein